MRLTIDGEARDLVRLENYRAAHDLPETFCVAAFEPKDYAGLGNLERAGTALNGVRRALLEMIPLRLTPQGWLLYVGELARALEDQLYQINDQVGLKPAEIGFAVSGFADVCQAHAYAYVRAAAQHTPLPEFHRIYAAWLADTVRVSVLRHLYPHHGAEWQVQVVTYAYGRVGLIVEHGGARDYVYDSALACPAEGFMMALLEAITERVARAIGQPV